MLLIGLITIAAVIATIIFVSKSKVKPQQKAAPKAKTKARSSSASKNTKQYQGVAIQSGASMCQAAQNLAENVYLSAEAPMLPLNDCDQSQCNCRYKRYDDRRQIKERRWSFGVAHSLNDGLNDERRQNQKKDRRVSSLHKA